MTGRAPAGRMRGLTLVELLIAAAIGSIVLGAVVQALVSSSRHFARADALAQMQAQADVALRFLRDDLRMAGHWGALRDVTAISGRAMPGQPNPLGLALPRRCAPAFTTDLARAVAPSASAAAWGCSAAAVSDSHALVVRFASAAAPGPQRNRLQLTGDTGSAALTTSAGTYSATTPGAAVRDLAVRGYYVAAASTTFPDQPVLRRLTLNALTTGPRYIDEEVTQGVEAMRVAAHVDLDGDGAADATLAAGDPALSRADANGLPGVDIVAVDVALVVRSESARWSDAGAHTFDLLGDTVTYPADGFMRMAVSQTVRVRNAGTPP